MLLLKGLECLLLLLLAGPARRVSAVLSCSSSGVLLDTSCSQWEDINAVFGIEVDYCSSGVVSGGIKRVHRCPPSSFPLADAPSPATDTVKIKWWDFGAVQLRHYSMDDCAASAAAINGHDDYDGPDIGCRYVCAILPVGGEIATNWGIRW